MLPFSLVNEKVILEKVVYTIYKQNPKIYFWCY